MIECLSKLTFIFLHLCMLEYSLIQDFNNFINFVIKQLLIYTSWPYNMGYESSYIHVHCVVHTDTKHMYVRNYTYMYIHVFGL